MNYALSMDSGDAGLVQPEPFHLKVVTLQSSTYRAELPSLGLQVRRLLRMEEGHVLWDSNESAVHGHTDLARKTCARMMRRLNDAYKNSLKAQLAIAKRNKVKLRALVISAGFLLGLALTLTTVPGLETLHSSGPSLVGGTANASQTSVGE